MASTRPWPVDIAISSHTLGLSTHTRAQMLTCTYACIHTDTCMNRICTWRSKKSHMNMCGLGLVRALLYLSSASFGAIISVDDSRFACRSGS